MANAETDLLTALQIERGVELDDKLIHLLERWAKVTDNARYMIFEHRFKEKEYGIKWRTVYKQELVAESDMLRSKYGEHLQDFEFDDRNNLIAALVEKDWKDVRTFSKGKQFDLMLMLKDNIDDYEVSLGYLRSILKNQKLHEQLDANRNLRTDFAAVWKKK